MEPEEVKVGMKVRLRPDCEYLAQSGDTVGTVIKDVGDDWWRVQWGHIKNGVPYEDAYTARHMESAEKGGPGRPPKAAKVAPEVVPTLDPYQFVRFYHICERWAVVFRTAKWKDAFNKGNMVHGGVTQMCAWLQAKGGMCMCGKPYRLWKKEMERVLRVKLVDYRFSIKRLLRRSK